MAVAKRDPMKTRNGNTRLGPLTVNQLLGLAKTSNGKKLAKAAEAT